MTDVQPVPTSQALCCMHTTISADEALARLRAGNQRYMEGHLEHHHADGARRLVLRTGQDPYAAILSCADSRVVPEIIFDEGLGDLFVVRVAGNVANVSSLASLEYAVAHLNVRLIVVLGHESCGAIQAACQPTDETPNLHQLLDQIRPAIQTAAETSINEAVRANARHTAEQAFAKSALLESTAGLRIVPAYYNLASGRVDFLDS